MCGHALLQPQRLDSLVEVSIETGRMTHNHPIGASSSHEHPSVLHQSLTDASGSVRRVPGLAVHGSLRLIRHPGKAAGQLGS